MKTRTTLFFEEEDKKMARFLREKHDMDSDASAVRYALRKTAKAEGYKPDKNKGKE